MNDVSVVVVNWNGKHLLSACLEGLRSQRYGSFATIVVDNGSSDGSVDFIKGRFPEVSVIALTENLGFAAANNFAIKTVDTNYIALLNNDAVPDPLWLEKLVDVMDRHPEAGIAASMMVFEEDRKTIDRAGDFYTTAGAALLRGRGEPAERYDKPEWVFGACAGAALYRTEMFSDTGMFDEDFFILYEDVDLSFRAQLKGYRCHYTPEAVVYHKGSGSLVHDSPLSVYYSHRNLEWVYIQNMPSRLLIKTIIPHIVYDIAALLYFVFCGRGIDFLKAKKDALKGLKRALKKRQQIQSGRAVDDIYIWSLFERPRLMDRLAGRSKAPTEAPTDDFSLVFWPRKQSEIRTRMTMHFPKKVIGGRRGKGEGKRSLACLPLITIITTIHNASNRIEKAIDEVQRQTYANKEHIVIDGGSQDGTVDILKKRDDEIDYWASEADAGIYDAMNKGIDAAGGEWIYFLGVDDSFYQPDTLESIMKNGELSDETALVFGNVLYSDGRLFRSRFDKKLYYKNSVHHQGAFYRNRVFDEFRYGFCEPSGRTRHFDISGDYQLNLRLFIRGMKSLYVDEIIARCGRGVSMEGKFTGYREELIIRHQYMNFCKAVLFDITTLLRYGWKQI